VSELKSQLGSVKEAVAKEQELGEKLRREAAAAAESAQRQVRLGYCCGNGQEPCGSQGAWIR
jgi:hypothetical protein